MSTDLEGRLRQRMELATAQIQMPHGLARRASRHRRRQIVIRAGVAAATAAAVGAVAAGMMVTAPPSARVVLTAKLLADRASAVVLHQPVVSPSQWVYRVVEWNYSTGPNSSVQKTATEAGWETADGLVTSGNNYSMGLGPGAQVPAYSQLGSLPREPAALDAYLARLVYPHSNTAPKFMGLAAFSSIEDMLTNYVMPPTLQAEMYRALAAIPAVEVNSHVTTIDGQAGVAFVLPPTPHSEKLEIVLDATNYRFLAQASWDSDGSLNETAVVKMVVVGGPGSTQPSRTPPSAAERLAERADLAWAFTTIDPLIVQPRTWILRDLATSSGNQKIWATADDSEQASYVGGRLRVCSRRAACAHSTRWLMPAGPSYTLVNPPIGRPPFKHFPPGLPDFVSQLLDTLNRYHTGCADVAGDCNAVNSMANIIVGYANHGGTNGNWYLMLADVPGVTVLHLTDVTGHADVAFRFPFTDGITEILLNPRTYRVVGYVRDGVQTVITKEATVTGPGSLTPAAITSFPRFEPAGRWSRHASIHRPKRTG